MSSRFSEPPPLRVRSALMCGLALLCIAIASTGCVPRSSTEVPVGVSLEHRLGDAPLVLDLAQPIDDTATPPSLTVSRLAYYLGRFRLQHADGRWFESARRNEPGGDYVRVELAQQQTLHFEPLHVPAGDYTALEFLVGVDPQRNRGGAQTGALDPVHGLFWTWRTGYIFFALEGRAPLSGARDHTLTFHLGGDDALARTVMLPVALRVAADGSGASLTLRVQLDEFFRGLPLDRTHTVMNAQDAAPLADRYAALFSVVTALAR